MSFSRVLLRNLSKALAQPGYALKTLRMRLASSWSWRHGRGRSAWPETVSLVLTQSCNLRCRMCGQWGESGAFRNLPAAARDACLSGAELDGLMADLARFRPNITLFGGEPLTAPNWREALEAAGRRGLRVNMVTNGTRLAPCAPDLVRLGLAEMAVSLDGPPDIHDQVRGIPGTFDRVAAGVAAVAAARVARGRRRPLINVTCTLSALNLPHLDRFLDLVAPWPLARLAFHHLIHHSPETLAEHDRVFTSLFGQGSPDWQGFTNPDLVPAPEAVECFVASLRHRRLPYPVEVYPNFSAADLRRYYSPGPFLPESYRPRCLSPWNEAYIFPDGGVRPCLSLGLVLGNIRDGEPFTRLWNAPAYQDFRRKLRQEGLFPACVRCTEFYRY